MYINRLTRRQFLQGSGGFCLSLPILSSLLSTSEAQAACSSIEPRFVAIYSKYGNVSAANWYPDPKRISFQNYQLMTGHSVRYGALPTSISPVFGSMFDSLRSKLTFIQGSDIVQRCSHGQGNLLGNTAATEFSGIPGCSTIDQVLADKIYLSPTNIRSLVAGSDGGSCSFKRNSDGSVQNIPGVSSAQALFNQAFGGYSGGGSSPLVVDRVLEDYRNTLNHPRLGQKDKETLQDVLDNLYDLQTRINSNVVCQNPLAKPPGIQTWQNTENLIADWNYQSEVIIAAFRCCVSKVATLTISRYQHPQWIDWHDHSHSSGTPASQSTILAIMRFHAERLFYNLISKMNQTVESNGKTLLDNSLVLWGMELSQLGDHSNFDNPMVFAGSANSKFQTGRYIDYRNHAVPYGFGSHPDGTAAKLGIPHSWLLMSILKGFGLSTNDARSLLPNHSAYNSTGYGPFFPFGHSYFYNDNFGHPYYTGQTLFNEYYKLQLANDPLPLFAA